MMPDQELPAGDFSVWLREVSAALRGERDAEVPCDGCVACCTSGQFVHIAPDETDTLAAIPPRLLAPAPLMPPGHVVLGYDDPRALPDAGRRGVLDLPAAAPRVQDVRLPGLRRRRGRPGRRGGRRARPSVAVLVPLV